MPGLIAAIEAMGLGGPDVNEDALWDFHNGDAIATHLKDLAAERLEQKGEENPEEWSLIERLVLLRTIDSIWVEHLTEIDELRQGIGLRGYAQEDPINAFKKEAFSLYEEMSALIRHQVATTIFRVSIVRPPAQPEGGDGTGSSNAAGGSAGGGTAAAGAGGGAIGGGTGGAVGENGRPAAAGGRPLPRPLPQGRPAGGSLGSSSGAADGPIRPGYSPAGVRMGRNDACWCGSGKKYKKCHGR